MVFGSQRGKPVNEGDLIEKFFNSYNQIIDIKGINIGWKLINEHFSED